MTRNIAATFIGVLLAALVVGSILFAQGWVEKQDAARFDCMTNNPFPGKVC